MVALLTDQDVPTAITVATNAVENNLIPAMIGMGCIAWEAYDLYQTLETEGVEAAAKKLGFTLVTAAAGVYAGKRIYQLGKIVATSAPEAIALFKQAHPVFAKFYDIAAAAIAKGVQKVKDAAVKFQTIDAKLEAKVGQAWNNITHKADAKLFSEATSKDLVTHLDPQYWNKRIEYKGNTVYQRNDIIDHHYIYTDGSNLTNLQRMRLGKAPYGLDVKKIELHHMLQTQKGPIAEVTQTFHKQYHSILHINTSNIASGINRSSFDQWRKNYWRVRANDFIEKGLNK